MIARIFALGTLVVGGLIFADLLAHYQTTKGVLNFAGTESKYLAGR